MVRRDVIANTDIRNSLETRSATTSSSSKSPSVPAQGQQPELSTSILSRLGFLSATNAVEPTVVAKPGTLYSPLGHMDLFSPVPTNASDSTEYQTAKEDLNSSTSLVQPTLQADKERKRRGILGADGLNEQSSQSTIVKSVQAPSIPPRPTPKPGGRLYLRRAQTSGTSVIGIRHAESSKHSRSLGVMRSTGNKRGSRIMSPERATVGASTNTSDEAWADVDIHISNADQEASANVEKTSRGTVLSPASHSLEGSHDTIVDWSANTSLPPAPTMNLTRTTTLADESLAKRPSSDKPTPTYSDPTQSSKSNDTIVQWSSLKKSPRIVDMHNGLQVDVARVKEPNGAVSPPPLPERVVRQPIAEFLVDTNANRTKAPNLPPRTVRPTVLVHASSGKPVPSSRLPSPQEHHQQDPAVTFQPPELHHRPHDLTGILQQSLHRELKMFHREIMNQFDMQKAWFRHETRHKDVWIQKLEDENVRLRHELSRMRRR